MSKSASINTPPLVAELNAQFAESAKPEKAIKANLRGLGYGEFRTNVPNFANAAVFSANGAAHTSPGQRPGYAPSFHQALKGRHNCCLAPSGLGRFLNLEPRALPWAGMSRPFGAAEGGGQ
jgi:hypothetical protein